MRTHLDGDDLNRSASAFVYFSMKCLLSRVRAGFTLVELSVVVLILAVLATLAARRLLRTAEAARITAAEADLATIRDAFLRADDGYLHDLAGIPGFSHAYLRVGNLLVATNVFGSKVVGGVAQTRGIRVDVGSEADCRADGRALPRAFTQWDEARGRGWRGPYVTAHAGIFPAAGDRRFPSDPTFAERGFFPSLSHLRMPTEFKDPTKASVYGFVGEPTLLDPWGNPYVVQIPPPQAFPGVTNVTDTACFAYARVVSAGPDGVLETPCFGANTTNDWSATGWSPRRRLLARQAGLADGTNREARGDDLVLFFTRNDVDEGEARESMIYYPAHTSE